MLGLQLQLQFFARLPSERDFHVSPISLSLIVSLFLTVVPIARADVVPRQEALGERDAVPGLPQLLVARLPRSRLHDPRGPRERLLEHAGREPAGASGRHLRI